MRAWVCKELVGEEGLVQEEMPSPECGEEQVLVRNHFSALNFPDALMTRGLYQFKLDPPFVPGSEFSGEIIALGESVTDFRMGQRVLALTGYGAFCGEVLVNPPMQQLHAIPDEMSYEDAAGFNMSYGTAIHALRQRGNLRAGETLLVLGAAGGCGSAAVQVGKALGAHVIAGCSSSAKCDVARASGADEVLDYKEGDVREQVKELTNGQGVDVVFDPVGDSLFDQAVRCVGWNGRYLVIGFAGGEIPKVGINYTILKSISIVGVAYGMSAIKNPKMNHENFLQLFTWYKAGKLRPVIGHQYESAEVKTAMAALYSGKALGKLILEFN